MALAMGLGVKAMTGQGGGAAPITTLSMTGLTSGEARPGDHASISVGLPEGVTAWSSEAWGVGTYGDTTYGTGANPTDYTASDTLTLLWEGLGDDGNTYRASAPIRYAAGSFAALTNQSFTDDTGDQTYQHAAASGTGLTWTYSQIGTVSGVSYTAGTRTFTFDTNTLAEQTGTSLTVRATDQYDRTIDRSFTFDITAAASGITNVGTIASGGNMSSLSTSYDISGLGLQENDVVLVFCGISGNTAYSADVTTSGFAQIGADLRNNGAADPCMSTWWKRMGASPDSSLAVLFSAIDTNRGASVLIRAYRGVNTTTAFDVTEVTDTSQSGRNVDPPSITPTTDGAMIVAAGGYASVVADSPTILTGTMDDFEAALGDGALQNGSFGAGDFLQTTAGAYNPAAFAATGSGASDASLSMTLALRPAA